jgi:hypothetical protein
MLFKLNAGAGADAYDDAYAYVDAESRSANG